jgi:hypothetical protein
VGCSGGGGSGDVGDAAGFVRRSRGGLVLPFGARRGRKRTHKRVLQTAAGQQCYMRCLFCQRVFTQRHALASAAVAEGGSAADSPQCTCTRWRTQCTTVVYPLLSYTFTHTKVRGITRLRAGQHACRGRRSLVKDLVRVPTWTRGPRHGGVQATRTHKRSDYLNSQSRCRLRRAKQY